MAQKKEIVLGYVILDSDNNIYPYNDGGVIAKVVAVKEIGINKKVELV